MRFKCKILAGRTIWFCNFSIPCFKKNELSPQSPILMVAAIQAASDLEEISREQSLIATSSTKRKQKQTSVHSTILLGQFKTKEMVLQASPLPTGTLVLYVTIYLVPKQIYERRKKIWKPILALNAPGSKSTGAWEGALEVYRCVLALLVMLSLCWPLSDKKIQRLHGSFSCLLNLF